MTSHLSSYRGALVRILAAALVVAAPVARATSTPAALSFSADRATVSSGQVVTLRWSGTNVKQCTASGAWRGSPRVVGVQRSTPISKTATFTLSCWGPGGSVSKSVTVSVASSGANADVAQNSADARALSSASATQSGALTSASIQPTLNLSVNRTSVKAGQQVQLRWSATQVQSCQASGGWNGYPRNVGVSKSGPLAASTTFTLTCNTVSGPLTRSVTVSVEQPTNVASAGSQSDQSASSASSSTGQSTPAPAPVVAPAPQPAVEPRLALQTSSSAVRRGDQVTLSWSGQGVSNCRASGDWSGARAASGSEQVASVAEAQSFTLRCDSARGEIVAMTSVEVVGAASIAWQQPAYNLDGTSVQGLRAVRIHVGTTSGEYTQVIEVSDLSRNQTELDLPPGEYFIAMSAVDLDGTESALSDEVQRAVQ
jgi:hypothetical protein